MEVDHLGRRIRNLRKASNLSQQDLSQILGVSRSAIASYENGSRYPDHVTLIKMASYFEVSVDYLLGVNTNKSGNQYVVLDEIATMLNQASIHPDEKKQVLQEVNDFFKWKLHHAQHRDRKE
ncbi:Cro/C1-type helix-turn-helix domain [Syntrophomonas zehnderi OL-4]|uniref:Cro/C1-type helix-turn-helix domain n=1 Tax=Syntrophomonas zehnderi OL-4 TaxID=690567 RepID=A0A0E4C7F4_9FIRM|nr:helix-turn-helix transcriptional regulator [Syntrophomonas zehnderi]CFW99416.1 Cro/C1-type helix-turn-helix domain [Syntrophomonas zehnderi OL-4]